MSLGLSSRIGRLQSTGRGVDPAPSFVAEDRLADQVDGRPPEPGDGAAGVTGVCDRFVGPDATWAEDIGGIACGVAGATAAPVYGRTVGDNWGPGQTAVSAALAFDFAGGVWFNSSQVTSRWYHREKARVRHGT